MRNRFNQILLAFIVLLTGFAIFVVWPDKPDRYLPDFVPWPSGNGIPGREEVRLGLDLEGGTYVLLEADTANLPPDRDLDDAMDALKRIIERRVNRFGVSETEIQREGANRLSVQLPGIDPDDARELIGKTALLQFREPRLDESRNIVCQADDGSEFSVPLTQASFDDQVDPPVFRCTGGQGQLGQVIWETASCRGDNCGDLEGEVLTGRLLRSAQAAGSPSGPIVAIEFDRDGSVIFEDVTTRLVNYPLGIFLDDELISAPAIQQAIIGGESQITGLDAGEARTLAIQLDEGALPLETRSIQETEVDATLGDQTVRRSIQAGLIGILAVMAFMILYYRLPGVLAALALVVYLSVLLMIFKLVPITLTLAGIAAFVLSVGMAVDANILVFERLKE
ncbi:MAG: protein translocase subunit SecD, partial [Dehalococcoidia bacterium]